MPHSHVVRRQLPELRTHQNPGLCGRRTAGFHRDGTDDGHGIGFQDESAPWGVERIGKTGQPSGIYDTYRIPFRTGVRVTAQRPKDEPGDPPFWWIVRGSENLPLFVGGVRLPDSARLKLYTVENRAVKPLEELTMYERQATGALYQVAIAAGSTSFEFLESCVRAYLSGSKTPVMLSSGLEALLSKTGCCTLK